MRRFWTYLKLAAYILIHYRRFLPIMLNQDQIDALTAKTKTVTDAAIKANASATTAAASAQQAATDATAASTDATVETTAMQALVSFVDGGCVVTPPTP